MLDAELKNPIWSALTTKQAHFAQGGDLARRFHPDITLLAGVRETSAEAFAALAEIMGKGIAGLLVPETMPSAEPLHIVRAEPALQMIRARPVASSYDFEIVALTEEDVPAMVSLAQRTEPGPFGPRTIDFGGFIGIRDNEGRLAAMAGRRMYLGQYHEISGVCTEPAHTGKGYATALVAAAAEAIEAEGEVPFLHVRSANTRAIEVYRRLGFQESARFRFIGVRA